jgi:hypothetical protein
MVWPPPQLVALPESFVLILHFTVDVKVLCDMGKKFPWLKPLRCPRCGGVRLWGHGFAPRYLEGFSEFLWMKRFRCPDCFAIHTCRPLGFLRGFRYSAEVIRSSLLKKIMENGWVRGVVRQNQQYWYHCLRKWASRLENVKLPSSAHLESFLSARIFPVIEHFAPLRI